VLHTRHQHSSARLTFQVYLSLAGIDFDIVGLGALSNDHP
jgi:hypothetical protein